MPDIDVSDEDRIAVREVYCFAVQRFSEADAFELAAQAFYARHWGISLRDAWNAVLKILGELRDPCPCQGMRAL
ncbi:MAG TPA: hypothetical protein VD978_05525 [Azospirillum sp.]|nr:hypothetical protein [Azospirillum sp.]